MTNSVVPSKAFELVSKLLYHELLSFQEKPKTQRKQIVNQPGQSETATVANLSIASRVPNLREATSSSSQDPVAGGGAQTPVTQI